MLPTDLTHYRRNLPHRLPPGETLFITFRLAGSLPREVVDKLRTEWEAVQEKAEDMEQSYAYQKRYFGRFDTLLDQADSGPTWLWEPDIAAIVQRALHFYDDAAYLLVCYCLMPNHVHLVITLPDGAPPLARTLQKINGYSGHQANILLGRQGQFWQRESYDHIVRNTTEMERIIHYVLENPVKAGFIDDWQIWPYTYWCEL